MFRRRKSAENEPEIETEVDDVLDEALDTDDSDDSETGAADDDVDRSSGPYDVSEVPDDGLARLDLGGLQVPGVEGMELRLEVDEEADQVVAVSVVTGARALIARMAGTSTQFGICSTLVNRPTIGMLMTSRITLAMNSDAIKPHTSVGCWVNSAGPGVML